MEAFDPELFDPELAERWLDRGLGRAVGLLRHGHHALAGASCLAPTDPRRARIATAAFLIETGLQDLEDLRRGGGDRAGRTGGA